MPVRVGSPQSVQGLTDEFIGTIDELAAAKEKEVLEV